MIRVIESDPTASPSTSETFPNLTEDFVFGNPVPYRLPVFDDYKVHRQPEHMFRRFFGRVDLRLVFDKVFQLFFHGSVVGEGQ